MRIRSDHMSASKPGASRKTKRCFRTKIRRECQRLLEDVPGRMHTGLCTCTGTLTKSANLMMITRITRRRRRPERPFSLVSFPRARSRSRSCNKPSVRRERLMSGF